MRTLVSFESRRTAQSRPPLRSCIPHKPLRADWARYSRRSWFSRFSFESLRAGWPRRSLLSTFTLDSLGTLRASVTLFTAVSDGTLRPSWPLGSLRSLRSTWISGVSFGSLRPLFSLDTLRADGAPFTNGASGTYRSPLPARVARFTFGTLPTWGAGCAGLTLGACRSPGACLTLGTLLARGAGSAGLTPGASRPGGACLTLRTRWTGRSARTCFARQPLTSGTSGSH